MIDISKINSGFSENTEPRDDFLLSLLKKAYRGDIMCQMAVADMSLITPFSNYQPKIEKGYYDGMKRRFIKKDEPTPALFVYIKEGKLVMSDDYVSYGLYKELNYPQALCVVVGDTPTIKGISYQGEPFKLQQPKIEEL